MGHRKHDDWKSSAFYLKKTNKQKKLNIYRKVILLETKKDKGRNIPKINSAALPSLSLSPIPTPTYKITYNDLYM